MDARAALSLTRATPGEQHSSPRTGVGSGDMYISIARYAGAAGKIGDTAPKVQQGFVPLLKAQPGFLGYAAFASEQGDIIAVGIWEDARALTNSRGKMAEWVQTN